VIGTLIHQDPHVLYKSNFHGKDGKSKKAYIIDATWKFFTQFPVQGEMSDASYSEKE
jgi:hypothetical protein